MGSDKIWLFDTTLRDGGQTRGVDFSRADKVAIAHALDDIGIDYIEAGWPGANPTDDAFFAKPFGDEDLPEGVVDLVSAGVKEVFALEVNFRSAQLLRPALGEIKWRRAPDIVVQEIVELGMKGRIIFCRLIGGCQFLQGSHQRLRHKHAAKLAEVA